MTVKYRFPLKRSPKSDPQRSRVYRMENEAIGARSYLRLTRRVVKRYINGLVREYRTPPIRIVFEDLGKWAAEWREPNVVVFGKKTTSRDLLTAAHEFAHHLHNHIGAVGHQDHGKEFMACYMSVLDTSRFIPVVGMAAICKAYGIEFVDFDTVRKRVRR